MSFYVGFSLSKLYFSIINGVTPRILHVNLNDGSGITVFHQIGLQEPNDLDIDFEVESLLWTDYSTNELKSKPLNGGPTQLIRGMMLH